MTVNGRHALTSHSYIRLENKCGQMHNHLNVSPMTGKHTSVICLSTNMLKCLFEGRLNSNKIQ